MYIINTSDDELDLNEDVSPSLKERKEDVEIKDYNLLPDFAVLGTVSNKKQLPNVNLHYAEAGTVIFVHETIMSHGCVSVCSSGTTHTAHSQRVNTKSEIEDHKAKPAEVKIKDVSNKSQNDRISSFFKDANASAINPRKCEVSVDVLSKQLKSASSASASEISTESKNSSYENEHSSKTVSKVAPPIQDKKIYPSSQRGRKRKIFKSEVKYPFSLKRRRTEEEEEDLSTQETKVSFQSEHLCRNDKCFASLNIDLAIHNPLNFTAQQLSECREKAAVISQNLKSSGSSSSSSEDSNYGSSAEAGDASFPKYSFSEALSLYDALRSAEGCGVATPDSIRSHQVQKQENPKVGNASRVSVALAQPQSVSATELSSQIKERSSKHYNSGVSLSQRTDLLNKRLSSTRQQLIENEALLVRTAQLFQYKEASVTSISSSQDDYPTKVPTRPDSSAEESQDKTSTSTTRNVSSSNSKTSNGSSSTSVIPNSSHSDTLTGVSSTDLKSDQSASECSVSLFVMPNSSNSNTVTGVSSTDLKSDQSASECSVSPDTAEDANHETSGSSTTLPASERTERKTVVPDGRKELDTKKRKEIGPSESSIALASETIASKSSSCTSTSSSDTATTSKEDGVDVANMKPSSVYSVLPTSRIGKRKRKMNWPEEGDDIETKKRKLLTQEAAERDNATLKPAPSIATSERTRPSISRWSKRADVRRGPEQPHVIRRRLKRLQENLDSCDNIVEELKQRKKYTNSGL